MTEPAQTAPACVTWVPAIISWLAVITSAVVSFFLTRKQDRDAAKQKSELDEKAATYQAELEKTAHEHQLRFSHLHQKRAEVIAELYALLRTLQEEFGEVIRAETSTSQEDFQAMMDSAVSTAQQLAPYYRSIRLYLDEPLCQRIDRFIRSAKEAAGFSYILHAQGKDRAPFQKDLEESQSQLRAIMRDIESEFRSILGVSDEAE